MFSELDLLGVNFEQWTILKSNISNKFLIKLDLNFLFCFSDVEKLKFVHSAFLFFLNVLNHNNLVL